MKKIITLAALLLPLSALAATEINGTEINLKANEQPITTAANPAAIAKLPKGLEVGPPGRIYRRDFRRRRSTVNGFRGR